MPPPDFLQDKTAQLKAELRQINDKLAENQRERDALQVLKQGIQNAIADVKAAYQAWKGVDP